MLTPGDKARLRRQWAEVHRRANHEAMKVLLPAEERRARWAIVHGILIGWAVLLAAAAAVSLIRLIDLCFGTY